MLKIAKLSFVTGPLCLFLAWFLMRPLGARKSPGLGWTVAHSVWIIGFVAFAVVCLTLRRIAAAGTRGQRLTANIAGAATIVGLVASAGQMVLDLYVGFHATTKDAMDELSGRIADVPGVQAAFYDIGPLFFFFGLVALTVVLAVQRRVALWMPALAVVDILVMAVKPISGLGIVTLGLALAFGYWRIAEPPRPAAVPVAATAA
ncbi:hypothetical protein Cs7R123_15620 [Catellatospora sp. TT07R-123]|uniref:hypothetical protein n=1 Tax=Catellatospora sp. TT07R-123 TaxID=2733863 RepID=UPI001B220972|nr:hypothetical protein [Catellatospora sp. TT07R-123]GHJ44220.1 hypothetical protein Cs7R123_15620 [Catellatospora sp. TT07R-123]